MLIVNVAGIVIVAIGFVAAYLIGLPLGATSEAPLMAIGGPLMFIGDLLYRQRRRQGAQWWYSPRAGGHLFFIPVWCLGLVWMALGTMRVLGSRE